MKFKSNSQRKAVMAKMARKGHDYYLMFRSKDLDNKNPKFRNPKIITARDKHTIIIAKQKLMRVADKENLELEYSSGRTP